MSGREADQESEGDLLRQMLDDARNEYSGEHDEREARIVVINAMPFT